MSLISMKKLIVEGLGDLSSEGKQDRDLNMKPDQSLRMPRPRAIITQLCKLCGQIAHEHKDVDSNDYQGESRSSTAIPFFSPIDPVCTFGASEKTPVHVKCEG